MCGRGWPDPWRYLRSKLPSVPVFTGVLEDGVWGLTEWTERGPEIHLAFDLGATARRCTLAHEIQHVEYGKPCRDECDEDEQRVVAATARWLLPDLSAVAGAITARDVRDAAKMLGVTRRVLCDRLSCLTEAETGQLRELLESLLLADSA
jgi:hypothetical protein